MNNRTYRLVYSRLRGMLVAVEETASSAGKAGRGETAVAGSPSPRTLGMSLFALRHTAFAVLLLAGITPVLVEAQVVAGGAQAPRVIQTPNGIQQVNINRPSSSGVSHNTYSQFDVPKSGVVLNNSPTIVNTQQAGYINGNPNFAAGQSAKIIVNQVNSSAASQLRGYVEVAGSKAEVVLANGSGIAVDGGGFINTSRAILTTGTPVIGANGALTGFDVRSGQITVQGAGLNATNIDQVDLIARAVQANAAIYANSLNVVTGTNHVDHDTLAATPIAGDGAAPGVSIDVSQLGGMYANRIKLVGTENGVGVSLAGITAAQAGDMTLTTQGRLVLSGKTNASGNMVLSAHDGIDNSGTTYAQQAVSVSTAGDVTNSGTLAAQQNLSANANNVASAGTLGAGINSDGSIAHAGDLTVVAGGTLSATGQNAAGGNATLQGAAVNLAGSQTSANGNLALTANSGDLNLASAKTTAGGTLSASAQGTLTNDNGSLTSAGAQTLTAGALSNQNGQIVSQGTLAANAAGAIANQGGTLQAAGALTASSGSLDNTAGHITSLNADGLGVMTAGLLNNGQGGTGAGTIGGNGNVSVQSGQLTNAGSITAVQNLGVSAAQTLANAGTLAANGNTTVSAGTTLTDSGGTISAGQQTTVSASTLDNSAGTISGNQLALHATDLTNHSGSITQTGTAPTTVAVSGTFDNANGSLQTNAADLALTPATLINDHGTIANAGTGTLSIATGNLSNNAGTVATNGALNIQAGALSNQGGKLAAQSRATLLLASLDNSLAGYVGAQDVTVTAQGALNNAGGTLEASDALTVSAQTIANDAGAIRNAGTQATGVTATGTLTNTQGGLIGGNGDVSVSGGNSGGSVDNSSGSIVAGGATSVQSGSALANAAGLIQGKGNVSVTAQGAVANAGGQIEANGATTTLQIAGNSLDNTGGRIANIGTGATTVNAASITNANPNGVAGAGTIGGNGDVTLTGQTLSNTQGAQIVAGHDLTLAIAQSVDNTGGTLSGVNNLTLNEPGAALSNQNGSIHGNGAIGLNVASLDNTSGRIGNDTGSGGSIAISTGTLTNQAGAIGSDRNLNVTTNQLTGDGKIIAGNDGAVTVNGSYTNDAANQIQANHDLTFTASGNFTNQGTLAAVNALTVNAANVDNQTGADLNSASTAVNAGNAITNEGRLEGDTVTTHSASLGNTGTIVGNNVTLNAGSIDNAGAAAAIAAATQLNLYASNALSNTGGANIFSLGDINIAADGTRDASGLLANRAGSVTNDQSTIEAQGNLEIATQTLSNTRPAPTVQTVTTGVDTVHQTKRPKYIACATTNADSHSSCTQAVWDYGYRTERTDTFASSSIVSQDAAHNQIVLNVNGQQQTVYYSSMTNNGGTVTLTYWDGYDPNVNYLPSTEYATRSDAHNGYQRVEIARDTTTTTQQDQVTGAAQEAQLLAGGKMTLANVGTINNLYSAIAAGNSIQIGSTQQNGSVGSGSYGGNYGGTTVNNTGQTLYQYQSQNIVSTYAWNEDITRDVGTVVEAPMVLQPVAIGGTGGTIIANNAVQINATNLNNTNVAAASSATGATGGTLGANLASAGVSASGLQTVSTTSGHQPGVNAPQSVASSTGALNITLPTGGLYSFNTAPGASYLIATDPRLTSYTRFISSDYMLGQLGLNPQTIEKRLGDGMYEEQLVRNQVTQLTGRVYLQGYTNNEDEYRALMTAGVSTAKQFSLEPGMALTAAQMDALTSDIVWLVNQTVTLPDGSTQQVLAPVVYLAHTHANDLLPTGALIAADDVELHAAGSVTNSGVIRGGTRTVLTATDILNRGGSIGSSAANGTTVVAAANDVVNASGQITGNRVAVLAGRDIVNTTLVDTVGVSAVSGSSRVNTTLLGAQGTIASTGDMVVSAGRDLLVHGANIAAGGDAQVTAGRDITVDAVQSTTSQSVTKNADHHWEANSTANQTSAISAGGSLMTQSGNDTTLKGAQVSAGRDLAVVAGGNLTATTVTNEARYDNVAADDSTRREVDHTFDQQAVGTTFSAGHNATLAAVNPDAGGNARTDGKGNVTLTGSSVTAGANSATPGMATILGNGNVTLTDAREEHDTQTDVSSRRGSFVSSTTRTDNVNQKFNNAVGSEVSGDAVAIGAGKDVTVRGSNVVGTNNVAIAALGNVNIVATQNTAQDSELHDVKHAGVSGTGGLGFSIGSSEQKDTYNGSSVTESQSRSTVGSVQGNLSIKAGQDVHIGGSDIVAGKAAGDVSGATGNIGIRAQNITIDPGQDTAQSHDRQEAHSSGFTVAVTGTPLDTARNLKKAGSSGNAYQRTTGIANEVTASTLDTPSVSLSYSHSSSSSTTDVSSTANAGSTIRGGGNVSLTATGGALKDAHGNPLDGDITVTGSTITAGGTTTLDANRNVTLQASTDQYAQNTQSGSSGSGFSLAAPSLGDVSRWVQGGPNSGGVSSSPYNASRSSANGDSSSTQQTATVVTGNSVVVKSRTGDIDVTGSGLSGTQGVDLVASQGAINVLAGTDTSTNHQESSSRKIGDLGSNGTGTGFSVGVANNHTVQDTAGQTQSTIRSQIVSEKGNVTLDANQDVTVQGSDLAAGKDLTLIGRNLNLDPGTDAQQSSMSQSASQYGVTVALGGVAGDTAAAVNRSMTQASHAGDARLAALDKAQAALAVYSAPAAAASGQAPALVKVTVSVGGGASHSEAQNSSTVTDGSTLTAGGKATLVATGSGAKDANGVATDGDINARGTQITAQDVTLNAARDINLQSAHDTTRDTSSNSSSNASIGVGFGVGGTQNGFTLELAASAAKGNANGSSVTNRDTQVTASNTVSITSGRDTNLRGAEVSGNTVDANVGRDLNIASQQDTSTYKSQQSSAGFQASICVPPFCYGQTVSGSANASDQTIRNSFQSVNQQSGIYAGSGGYNINVGNHTQLDGGVIASTATPDKNSLSTQTFGYTNLQNTAEYSGSTIGFSASTANGQGAAGALSIPGMGPTGFGMAGTGGSASGTTYAAVSPGAITVRGDAGTGHDSTAGLSRNTASANGAVQNTFDAQKVQTGMAIQQATAQVGMQVVGDIGTKLHQGADDAMKQAAQDYKNAKAAGDTAGMAQAQADYTAASQQLALWADDGAARVASHAVVAAAGAAMGGGSVAGAVGGTVAGDIAGNAAGDALGNSAGGRLLANVASGVAGAAAGGALGGSAGAMSGANGALGADLYNRQLHPDEKAKIRTQANGDAAEEKRLTAAACYVVQCWAEFPPNSAAFQQSFVSIVEAASLQKEISWVQSQQSQGYFNYTIPQQFVDYVKANTIAPTKDAIKVVTGGSSVVGGIGICAGSGAGCIVGVPMAAMGASDFTEGATGLYNFYKGNGATGFNPAQSVLNSAFPTWGNTLYDAIDLGVSFGGLFLRQPLNLGAGDGLGRPQSMFGVTVPAYSNTKLLPLTNMPLPGVNQPLMIFGVGSKGVTVYNDATSANGGKN
ncbi:hemagglutinin repeat-containing protein [Paraburkholderia sp. DD10]|uniref:hemagglutinin repeat-containing protein n=1 Tax=Paraburkholderia sp. DD10 TaxID=3409691 RepID=UPI003B9E9183